MVGQPYNDDVAYQRARRRAFIRAHHPDHGGDPETFITGLAELSTNPPSAPLTTHVNVHTRASLPRRLLVRLRRRWHPPAARVR